LEIFLDCLPCLMRQALEASRMATNDAGIHNLILRKAALKISDFQSYKYAPEIGREIHSIVKEASGCSDPYKEIKESCIKSAENIFYRLKELLDEKQDRTYWALKISATGNIIDAAIYSDIEVDNIKLIENEVKREFAICDLNCFKDRLKTAKKILIIGDNSGESVFDRVLADELSGFDITYAVRSEPIINDVTYDDAVASGLDTCTNIVSTGCNVPGVIIEECDEAFKNIFNEADIVISKGQGNYETMSEQKREIFFLLKAKCPVLADMIGVNVGDYVFKFNK